MFTDKIPEWTQELMGLLSPLLPENTYLAGGTALTLHLNHRQSFDLDLYSPQEFGEQTLIQSYEESIPDFKLISQSNQTIIGSSKDTEISLFYYQYPLLNSTQAFNNLPIASLEDIATMKIEAVAGRGLKRDFFDLYTICQIEHFSLKKIIELNQQKYQRQGSDLPHILKSLTYFDDAEALPERAVIDDSVWQQVKDFFISEMPKLMDELLHN